MFSFNRNEQIALILLSGALLIGAVVSLLASYAPDPTPDFEVRIEAVALPPAAVPDSVVALAPIDLNQASAKDLQRLPRIGPQTARRIVEYREPPGRPYRLRGIGQKTFERLRPLATVKCP